jgi:sorbose reductase
MPASKFVLDLSQRCIVVSGGNRGIGLALSKAAAQAGADVAILYKSSTDADAAAKAVADEFGVRARAFQCDVADADTVRAARAARVVVC